MDYFSISFLVVLNCLSPEQMRNVLEIKLLKTVGLTAVQCGGRKTSPRTSTIVQLIFYFGPLGSAGIF